MPKLASLRPTKHAGREREGQWCVNVPAALSSTGKRQRLFFSSEREAKTECELIKTRKVNFGHSLSSLSAARIAEASACYARLDALGVPDITLTAAVTEFLAQRSIRTASVTMSKLWEKLLISKKDASSSYRQELASTFNRLGSLADIACDVTAKQIEESLIGFPPAYRNAALRYLRAAFNFGIRSAWLKESPIRHMEFTKIIRDQVEVIAPAKVEKLLLDAIANDLELVPFLTLAFYACWGKTGRRAPKNSME
jgi:hypothetical protein